MMSGYTKLQRSIWHDHIGKNLGWEQAMKQVKALPHPEEARRG